MDSFDLLLHYALSFAGKPYKWGGEGPYAYDCSGFVQEILRAVGMDPPSDQTAQGLHDFFLVAAARQPPSAGSLAFYGASATKIAHVAFCLSPSLVIEAGGGGRETVTPTEGAMVRIRPIFQRKDFIVALKPRYRLG